MTQAATAEATAADQGLDAVFAGPGPIDKEYFTTFRDLLPAARALSDADFMAAVRQVNNTGSVC
jgi:hypothetical protein